MKYFPMDVKQLTTNHIDHIYKNVNNITQQTTNSVLFLLTHSMLLIRLTLW